MGIMDYMYLRPPIVEGKCPPVYDEEKGWYYPEPDPDYKDPEEIETDTFFVSGKEEYYGYETVCRKCGTRFQARNEESTTIRNYCPGCGEKL